MADHDEPGGERKDETKAEHDAREARRREREAAAKAQAEARAQAQARAEEEAAARARAREAAKAEAKAAEAAKAEERAQERAERRARAEAAAREADRAKEEAKARARAAQRPEDATGRQRLIDAAMRLHGEKRNFGSLGIREIAREANLNPNTFYRHFESLDDLAVAGTIQVGDRLRPMLRQIRRLASRVDPATVAALEVAAFYAFVLANPDAFIVGIAEYHAGSERVRKSIGDLLEDVANEMRDEVGALGIFPTISPEHLAIVCKHIVVHLFHLAQDYIEKPDQREAIIEASEYLILWLFAGAAIGTPANYASLRAMLAKSPQS
jgi:AcrR family transcriptional regulator